MQVSYSAVIADILSLYYLSSVARLVECSLFFFFQAEDGIRDLVRSRGLGDVYKRQMVLILDDENVKLTIKVPTDDVTCTIEMDKNGIVPVSYTHLTLPTSDLV